MPRAVTRRPAWRTTPATRRYFALWPNAGCRPAGASASAAAARRGHPARRAHPAHKEKRLHRQGNATELLDGPLLDGRALRGNLRDLRRINRLLGGVHLSRSVLRPLLAGLPAASLIDVGTGGADIPIELQAAAGDWGCRLSVVAVDSRPEVLAAARALDSRLESTAGSGAAARVTLQVADGLALPWPDRSFDVAHASLVLHHLEPDDARSFLTELARVSRRAVIVNDLARGTVFWALAWLGTRLLTRNRLTRHDAPLSVRRSYTADEVRALFADAGLEPVSVATGIFGHRFAIAAVPRRGSRPEPEDGL